jgi:hypothetical protein
MQERQESPEGAGRAAPLAESYLWWRDASGAPLQEKIAAAAEAHRLRTGNPPSICLVSVGDGAGVSELGAPRVICDVPRPGDGTPVAIAVAVRVDGRVPPHSYYLGVANG